MNLKDLQKSLLKDPGYRAEYDKSDLCYEISCAVVEARVNAGLTQKQLASKVGTKQPSIARIENGLQLPSMRFLEKIARALNTELLSPSFKSIVKTPKNNIVVVLGGGNTWVNKHNGLVPSGKVYVS